MALTIEQYECLSQAIDHFVLGPASPLCLQGATTPVLPSDALTGVADASEN
jgi:hypothetical protein